MSKWLQDDKGNESSLRKLMAVWMIGVFTVWAIISIWKMELMDLPAMIGTVIMFILGAKVWQKYAEKPSTDEIKAE